MALKQRGESHGASWEIPHARERWDERVDEAPANLFARWEEAEPIDSPRSGPNTDVRYHPGTDTQLIANFGAITTVLRLSDCKEWEQGHVRDQVEEGTSS